MTDPRKDSSRRCTPFEEWPENDRLAWNAALRAGDHLLDEDIGLASHWRPASRKKVASSYGRFLTFLSARNHLAPQAGPAERMTPDSLKAFIVELKGQVAPVTLAQRLTDIYEALRVMAPNADLELLRKAARRQAALANPSRDKRSKVVHPRRLMELGIRIMEKADQSGYSEMTRACRFRDGLMIAVLAARPIRRGNFMSILIGHHLIHDQGGYTLVFSGDEMKNHDAFELHLPAVLSPYIDRYLSAYRPILLAGNGSDSLWISYLGRPMASGSIYDKICEITEREFGFSINPHQFRDCFQTSVALNDPKHISASPRAIGHRDFGTGERFYNQAGTVEAARQYQAGITAIRQELAGASKRHRTKKGPGEK